MEFYYCSKSQSTSDGPNELNNHTDKNEWKEPLVFPLHSFRTRILSFGDPELYIYVIYTLFTYETDTIWPLVGAQNRIYETTANHRKQEKKQHRKKRTYTLYFIKYFSSFFTGSASVLLSFTSKNWTGRKSKNRNKMSKK